VRQDREVLTTSGQNNGNDIERAVNEYLENDNPDRYNTAVVRLLE